MSLHLKEGNEEVNIDWNIGGTNGGLVNPAPWDKRHDDITVKIGVTEMSPYPNGKKVEQKKEKEEDAN